MESELRPMGSVGLGATSGAGGKGIRPDPGKGSPVVDFHLFFFLSHRKMAPRVNRWMTCLTFLFRVEVKSRSLSCLPRLFSP